MNANRALHGVAARYKGGLEYLVLSAVGLIPVASRAESPVPVIRNEDRSLCLDLFSL